MLVPEPCGCHGSPWFFLARSGTAGARSPLHSSWSGSPLAPAVTLPIGRATGTLLSRIHKEAIPGAGGGGGEITCGRIGLLLRRALPQNRRRRTSPGIEACRILRHHRAEDLHLCGIQVRLHGIEFVVIVGCPLLLLPELASSCDELLVGLLARRGPLRCAFVSRRPDGIALWRV